MLYKRISNALCLAMCLSMAVMHNVSAEGTKVSGDAVSNLSVVKTEVLKCTDKFAGFLGLSGTKSLVQVMAFLLIVIPLIKNLTDGRKFNNASSDERLAEALRIFKQNPLALISLRSLSRELYYKIIRMIRSKLGHRSYLITLKEERTKNSDGTTNSITELKTVSATGLCAHMEDVSENLIFLVNSAIGMSAIQKVARAIEENRIVDGAKNADLKYVQYH